MSSKRWLFVCRRPPYGSGLARAGLDMALAAAAFDQPVALLFMDDGVWQLLRGQQGELLQQKDFDRQLSAASLYGITDIHVAADALRARGLAVADLVLDATLHEQDELAALLDSADLVFDF